ncbi:MAG: hypothetical protein ACP5G1_03980 [Nanopusillaceae archaeon]
MPNNVLEVVLIFLVLFFSSQIFLAYLKYIANPYRYSDFIANYIHNNNFFCVNLVYLYPGSSLGCVPSEKYLSSVSVESKMLSTYYENSIKTNNLRILQSQYIKGIYGVASGNYFILPEIKNGTIIYRIS